MLYVHRTTTEPGSSPEKCQSYGLASLSALLKEKQKRLFCLHLRSQEHTTLSLPKQTQNDNKVKKFILEQCVPPEFQTSVGQDALPLWKVGKMRAMLRFFDLEMFIGTHAALLP